MTTEQNRDRILASLHREVPDAIGVAEMIFWPETVERWQQEGLPAGTDPGAYFDVDSLRRSVVPDLTLQMEPSVIREDENVTYRRNANGVTMMEKKGSYVPPAEVDFTVKNREDWLRVKPAMKPNESRIPADFREKYAADQAANSVLLYKNPEPCWAAFKVLGYENTLIKMAEDPELVQDMFATYTDMIIGLYEILDGLGLRFDVNWLNSDVCYRNGMLFSPRMYERLVFPHHQRLTAYFSARGIPTVFHTCGNVQQLIPLYIKAGVRGIHPLEVRAGNDVREFRQLYGNELVFIGNINADKLSGSKEDIETEIRDKVPVVKHGGAYVFHSDHSIPPTVSLENYRYALELMEECGQLR
jgi:uroporphyrinogen decarboxylase